MVDELKITDLNPQKKDKDRINVYLNGNFAFGLSLMVAASLRIGQTLTPKEIEKLKAIDEIERAKTSAYRFLSYRPRSITELKRQLKTKGFEDTTIDRVIERLIELDLIDDRAFAKYWVEQRETFKPRGQRALRYELRQKGVDRQIVDEVVAEVDDLASARSAAQKRIRIWNNLSEEQFKDKLSNYLHRRGFNYEVVREITQEVWNSICHDENHE